MQFKINLKSRVNLNLYYETYLELLFYLDLHLHQNQSLDLTHLFHFRSANLKISHHPPKQVNKKKKRRGSVLAIVKFNTYNVPRYMGKKLTDT